MVPFKLEGKNVLNFNLCDYKVFIFILNFNFDFKFYFIFFFDVPYLKIVQLKINSHTKHTIECVK